MPGKLEIGLRSFTLPKQQIWFRAVEKLQFPAKYLNGK
jgi:hypothetical protein